MQNAAQACDGIDGRIDGANWIGHGAIGPFERPSSSTVPFVAASCSFASEVLPVSFAPGSAMATRLSPTEFRLQGVGNGPHRFQVVGLRAHLMSPGTVGFQGNDG